MGTHAKCGRKALAVLVSMAAAFSSCSGCRVLELGPRFLQMLHHSMHCVQQQQRRQAQGAWMLSENCMLSHRRCNGDAILGKLLQPSQCHLHYHASRCKPSEPQGPKPQSMCSGHPNPALSRDCACAAALSPRRAAVTPPAPGTGASSSACSHTRSRSWRGSDPQNWSTCASAPRGEHSAILCRAGQVARIGAGRLCLTTRACHPS